MIADDEVQRLFQDMFTARRAIAQRAEELRIAELTVTQARADLDSANAQLTAVERSIQRLAERVAGVPTREPDAEPQPPAWHSEFRPVRR